MINKLREKYLSKKKENPRLVSLENEELNGAADEFADTMGGSRIDLSEVYDEEFLEIERTPAGYEAHVLEEHKDSNGDIRKVYTEEEIPDTELGDAIKSLDIGDSIKIHLTGKDATELAKKRAPYVHSMRLEQKAEDEFTRHVFVGNQYGIHARPATMLAKESCKYGGDITASYEGNTISGKSIIGWMTLGASYGSEIVLRTEKSYDSNDSTQCLDGLVDLFERKFDED